MQTEQSDEEQLKEYAAQIKKHADELENRNNQLNDFCNIVPHNLRAPLVNISMLIDLIETAQSDKERTELISKIKPVTQHLNEIFNELVESLQVKQDTEIEKDVVDLQRTFNNTVRFFETELSKNDIEIICDFKTPTIFFPQKYADSMFLNLISNSIKYRVKSRKTRIRISSVVEDQDTILTFEDNGLGINLELHKDKIFKIRKVFHEHPDAKGFGLFMTKTQIEAMGGKIWVESEPNVGSKFYVSVINQQLF